MKPVVCVIEKLYQRSEAVFNADRNFDYVVVSERLETVMAETVRKHQAFAVVVGTDRYTDKLYAALPKGGIIARYGVGHDGIDKDKATAAGILVTNTPQVLDNSVAELAIWFMGTLSRQIVSHDNLMKSKKWIRPAGRELKGKTLLILGCGNIGGKVAHIAARGLGLNVIGFDLANKDPEPMKQKWVFQRVYHSLEPAIPQADFISVHLPANDATRHFINREFLAQMKQTAYLINTARGSIVDENALYDAVHTGQIAGAGLDVFENEPYEPVDAAHDLRTLPQIVLTPHIGSSTEEASERMARLVLDNLAAATRKEYPKMNIVNPNVVATLS